MKNALLLAVVAIAIVSCSKEDPVSPPADTGFKRPNVGSSFTYEGYQLDAAGNKVPGTDFEAIHTVIDTGLTIAGKSGVWALRVTGPTGADTLFQCKDANKDLYQLTEIGEEDGAALWVRFPITTTVDSRDSVSQTRDFNGLPLVVSYVTNVKRIAETTVVVGTESIKAQSMSLSLTVRGTILGQEVVNATITQSSNFAPSIGAFVLNYANEQTITAGNVIQGFYQKLKAYTLK